MKIRTERPGDLPAIHALVTAAFGQSQEADLVDALRRSGDLLMSLVAEDDSGLIGHVAFSRLKSPKAAQALAPVAVAPARQRSGIGSALIRAGLERAHQQGCSIVFVLGEPEYYTRFGFRVETAAPFSSPYAGPYFMALVLDGSSPEPAPVIYAGAFSCLGGT